MRLMKRRVGTAHGAAMSAWIVWLIVAAVLGVAELLTTTFALGIIAVAALVAAGVGALGLVLPIQLAAFVVASGAGLGFVLPIARRHVRQPPLLRTGAAALVGRPAQVLEEVTGYAGRVRIGGEVWSARSYDETLVIPAGRTVDVMQIEGATALVYPRDFPLGGPSSGERDSGELGRGSMVAEIVIAVFVALVALLVCLSAV